MQKGGKIWLSRVFSFLKPKPSLCQLEHSHSSNGDSGTGTLRKGRHRFCGWAGWSDVVHSHIDLEINNQEC